jgi:hypothetical protein
VTKTRLEQIFDEIVKHVRWTGDVILSADNPAAPAPKIGWCTKTGTKSWSISVEHVRQDLNAMQDQTKADLLRKVHDDVRGTREHHQIVSRTTR